MSKVRSRPNNKNDLAPILKHIFKIALNELFLFQLIDFAGRCHDDFFRTARHHLTVLNLLRRRVTNSGCVISFLATRLILCRALKTRKAVVGGAAAALVELLQRFRERGLLIFTGRFAHVGRRRFQQMTLTLQHHQGRILRRFVRCLH